MFLVEVYDNGQWKFHCKGGYTYCTIVSSTLWIRRKQNRIQHYWKGEDDENHSKGSKR